MQPEITLSQKLLKIPSFSGNNPEIIEFIEEFLTKIGFSCQILEFDSEDSYKVNNIHAIFNPNKSAKTLYFAGHTDVVSVGDEENWKYPPFSATIEENKLFSRGTSDMKCAVACFLTAIEEFIAKNPNPNFGIGLIITNDEESDSINGTKKVLQWMSKQKLNISTCIIGEPTNPNHIGEMAKIGRRGSINFELKITGKQGHVAYAQKALNPITAMVDTLNILKNHKFDNGNEFFSPTNLEITNINSDNFGNNVIPNQATANFNVRFNSNHKSSDIFDLVKYVCEKNTASLGYKYELAHKTSGESFLSKKGPFCELVQNAIQEITGETPVLGTTGGTSDARFIKDYCDELIEFGLINETAHKVDEFANLDEITKLKEIYLKILKKF